MSGDALDRLLPTPEDRARAGLSPSENVHTIETIAAGVLALIDGHLEEAMADFRWMQTRFLAAEMQFRRSGSYKQTDPGDLHSGIYAPDEMRRYMTGLLMSQVLWPQHRRLLSWYLERFLPECDPEGGYLEIGPGHGLTLALSAKRMGLKSAHGWDVSETSLAMSRQALSALSPVTRFCPALRDVCEPPRADDPQVATAVLGQVLEVVPSPEAAMRSLAELVRPGGRLFLNCPIEAAAPDHVRRWTHSDQIDHLLKESGFRILQTESVGVGRSDGPSLYAVIAERAAETA